MTAAVASAPGSERLHGLDAVRGYALLLGVIFHATMSFLPGLQIWLVKDSHPAPALGAVFFLSHTFRMTTFFVIAGFMGHMMVEKRGVMGFIRDRAKRIALPLVVGWPIIFASILAAGAFAAYLATGHVPTRPPAGPPPPPFFFPLTHLWFLYILLLLYAFVLAVSALVRSIDRKGRIMAFVDRLVRAVLTTPAAGLLLALPAAAAFFATPTWLPWFGVPTPDMSLIPNMPASVEFGLAFSLGWLVHRQSGLLSVWRDRWPLNLTAAVILLGGCLAWLGVEPVVHPPHSEFQRGALALAYGAGMWTATLAAIGMALRFLSGHSPVRRYIADSSYWIYLIHLPVVIVLQAWVSRLDWPWELKFAAVLGVGFPLMFASYHLLVRRTFLGAILNGRRAPKPAPRLALQPEAAR